MILRTFIRVGILGGVISLLQFSKYCRLLNKGWALDPETMRRYQARAQRYLAAAGCLTGGAVLSIILAAIFSAGVS